MPISLVLQQVRGTSGRGSTRSAGGADRRHFQKNSLISGTFEPPEMYSTRLVVDRQHRRADERLAGEVGQLDLDRRLLARLVLRLRRQRPRRSATRFSGGTTISRTSVWTLPSATVSASTKKLGMSFVDDGDLLDRALALAGGRTFGGR